MSLISSTFLQIVFDQNNKTLNWIIQKFPPWEFLDKPDLLKSQTEWTTLLIQSYDWLRSFTTSVHSLIQTLYMQSFQIPTVGIHVQTNSGSKRKWHSASGSSLLYSSGTVSNNSNAHKEDRLHEWKNPAGGCRLQIPTVGIWKARGNNQKEVYPLLCFIITGFM